ncbi:MAG: TolC family protein [Pseudomonadota bacterium]
MRLSIVIACSAVLTGCVLGHDPQSPDVAEDFEWQVSTDATDAAVDQWWTGFADRQLDQLVQKALANNRDLRQAQWRVAEARAAAASANGARLPTLALDARYTRFEQSIESPQAAGPLIEAGIVPRDGEFYTTSLLASWELDIFGRLRRQAQASRSRALAATAGADATALQVIAETVSAYNDWTSFALRKQVAEQNVALQTKTLDIVRGKVRVGLARRVDEVRALANLEQLAAQVPLLEAERTAAARRLSVLLGELPGVTRLRLPENVMSVPSAITVGLPAAMLRRRPDVQVAEFELAAASATTSAAVAAFFPTLALNASGGFEAERTSDLASGPARVVGIVPFVRWPVFQGGRLRAQLNAAKAREKQALARYEQAVLLAIADTETAIAGYAAARASVMHVLRAQGAAAEAELLARRLYDEGLTDFLTLLDAQRQLAQTDDNLIATRASLVLAATRLYKSLGGSWTQSEQ